MRNRTLITILIFTGLVLLSRWLVTHEVEPGPAPTNTTHSAIDYQLEQFDARDYGKDGRLVYSLTAPAMSRFAVTAETKISKPKLTMPQLDKKGKTTLIADEALITSDLDMVFLRGSVVIKSRANNQQTAIISTESMDINIESQVLSTLSEVSIKAPGMQLQTLGMTAKLGEETLILKQQVNGQYAAY